MIGLVADIGSTNARFALADDTRTGSPSLTNIAHLACAQFPSLTSAISAYLKTIPPAQMPKRATLAIAGPVSGERIRLTNHPWEFSAKEVQTEFGFDRVHIINDFAAISLSLPIIPPASLVSIGPDVDISQAKCFGVVGPGTGLGVGGLLRIGNQAIPLPSEGGHMSFAATNEIELKIARVLIDRFGHVSNERLLSGPGLANIYEALNSISGKPGEPLNPEQITAHALAKTNATCRDALEYFCAILGSAAGDLALLLCAEAIYIAGGIVPRIIDLLRASEFRARFENKGRFTSRLKQIPTFVIIEPNPGLLGAAVDLTQFH